MATRAEWARRVERWQRSGLTAKEFGRCEGIDSKQLSTWKWKLGTQKASGAKTKRASSRVELARVEVVAPADKSSESPVEIVVDEQHVVRVRAGFDAAALASVLDVLDGGRGE